ncbi:MAG: hypothetical protein IKT46_08080 [Clostridia bacterium]|nr:hypothetical protein [Clostridia bacterium]
MTNKQRFYKIAEPFFLAGLFKEIYQSDDISICNIANSGYAVFMYSLLKPHKEDEFAGIFVDKKGIRSIVNNNSLIQTFYLAWPNDVKKRSLLPLNDRTFKIIEKFKKKTDENGPSHEVDLEMEKEIMAME